MNLSGILVVARPGCHTDVVDSLRALEGLEVHQVEEETGRIVAVQEAADINAEVAALRRIKALPNVLMAEMVYHYVAEDERAYAMPAELRDAPADFAPCGPEPADACAVPAYLNA